MRNAEDAAADVTLFLMKNQTLWALQEKLSQLSGIEQIWPAPDRIRLRLADEEVASLAVDMINTGLPPLLRQAEIPEEYVISFCDPNATKALHIGHMRSLALGGGLGALLEAASIQVTRQSIVCDCGRAVAEACAGYAAYYQGETPRSQGCRPDQFVGKCYTRFGSLDPSRRLGEPDHDSRGRLESKADLASDYMKRLRDEDPAAEQLWQKLRRWVIEGHLHTFERIGLKFDRTLYESEFLGLIEPVMRKALARGVFIQDPTSKSVDMALPPDRQKVPMVRGDGFPTGYLRHFVIWHELERLRPPGVGYINIMGNEWTEKTVIREKALATLIDNAFDQHYHRIGVGMVEATGRPIKSKTGTSFLIEDCLDWIAGELSAEGTSDPPGEISALILKSYLLSEKASAPIEFSLEHLLDPRVNPGIKIVGVLLDERNSASTESQTGLRYAVCRALEMRPILQTALVTHELAPVMKYLGHLAGWRARAPQGSLTQDLTLLTIEAAARSINLLSASAE